MAYATNMACTEIYMVTHWQPKKFQNLTVNPAVSLMIDTRYRSPRAAARAMTVEGVFQKISDPAKKKEGSSETIVNPSPFK